MAADDKVFAGDVPANYQKFLVPMIFAPYAREVAERLRQTGCRDVLEIAAGTGVLTRAMAAALGPEARITATDLNQPMLDAAMAEQAGDGRIAWEQADGTALPFEDESFDAVACQFGVMFFPDKVKGYSEARRVLRPGGRYIFDVWDRIENNEFVTVVKWTLDGLFPADPPRFMERTPHGYWSRDVIADHLQTAGFASIAFESLDHRSCAASALDAATGYCMGTPLAGEIEVRAPGQLPEIVTRVAEALEKRFGTGPIEGKIRAHIITATR